MPSMSWRSCARAGEAGAAGRAGGAEVAHAVAVSATAIRTFLLANLIQRLDDVVEVGGIGLRGAGLARPRGEDVTAGLAEGHLVFFLALFELHGHRERRLVEAGLGG